MKKGIYKSIIYIGIIMCCFPFLHGCIKSEVKISEIDHFDFGYQVGNYMNGTVKYEIKYEEDKWYAYIKPNEVAEESATKIEIKEDKVKELENILKEYKIGKWNGFQKSDKHVLDGHSFHLYVWFKDKTSIHASGYEMYPSNYKEFRNKMDEFFKKIDESK